MHDNSAMCRSPDPRYGFVDWVWGGENKWRLVTMTNRASDTAVTLDTIVARLNIERYRKKLSAETDETVRRTLLHLVAEEKAKLFALLGSAPAIDD
jgi:hypothetical protein